MSIPNLPGKHSESEAPLLPRDDVNSPSLCLDSALAYVVRNATFFLEQPKFADSLLHWDVEVRRAGLTKYLLNHRFVYNLINEIQQERGSAGLVMELTKAILNVDFTRSRRVGKGDTVVDVINAILSGDVPEFESEDEESAPVPSVVVDLIPFALLQLKLQGNSGSYRPHITDNLVTLLSEFWKRLSPDIPGMLELPGLLCAVDNVMTDWVRVPSALLMERQQCVRAGLSVCRLYVRRMLELLPSLVTLPEYARIRTALVQVEKRVQVAGNQWTHLSASPHQSVLPAPLVHKKPRKSPMRARLEDCRTSPPDETLWDDHGNPVLDKCPSSPSIFGPIPGWVRVSPGFVRPATAGYRSSTRPFTALGRNGARGGANGLSSSPSQHSLGSSPSWRDQPAKVDCHRWEPSATRPVSVTPSEGLVVGADARSNHDVDSSGGSGSGGTGPARACTGRERGRTHRDHGWNSVSSGGGGPRGGEGSKGDRSHQVGAKDKLIRALFHVNSRTDRAQRATLGAGAVTSGSMVGLPSSPSVTSLAAGVTPSSPTLASSPLLLSVPSFHNRASLEVLQASLQSTVAAVEGDPGRWDPFGGDDTPRAGDLEDSLGIRRGSKGPQGQGHSHIRSANSQARRTARGEDELTDLERRVAKLRADAEARAKERARAESRRRRKERLRQMDPIEAAIIVQAAFRGYLIRARIKREAIDAHLHHVRAARQMTRARLSDLRYMRGLALEDKSEAAVDQDALAAAQAAADADASSKEEVRRRRRDQGRDSSDSDNDDSDEPWEEREHLGPPSMRVASFSGYDTRQEAAAAAAELAKGRRASFDTALMLQRAGGADRGRPERDDILQGGGNGIWKHPGDACGSNVAAGILRPQRLQSPHHYRVSVGPGCSPRQLMLHAGMSAGGGEAGQGYWHVQPAGADPGAKGAEGDGSHGRSVSATKRELSRMVTFAGTTSEPVAAQGALSGALEAQGGKAGV